jgi:GNAT superfamily N-acetyltransferase
VTVRVEPLAASDVETLCDLAAAIWRRHYPPLIGSAQTDYMLAQRYAPEAIRAELRRDDVWWDVLTIGGRMVAFASSLAVENEIKLDKLYVAADHQRRGFGGVLIAHVCARARLLGYRTVMLAVNKRNEHAIAAYLKHGFTIREAVVKDIGSGFVMDDYIMARECAG